MKIYLEWRENEQLAAAYLSRDIGDGREIVTNLELTQIRQGETARDPPLKFEHGELVDLANQLYSMGIQPTISRFLNQDGHLQDMRAIAFQALKMTKP